LKLTASPRSQQVLEEAQEKNHQAAEQIVHALAYIRSNPVLLADGDLDVAAKRVAQALWSAGWSGRVRTRFNEAGDKAMVDFTFEVGSRAGMCVYAYTGTFHRLDGVWILRGIHEASVGCGLTPGIISRKRRILRSAVDALRSPWRALSRL
jgi:hypothetical protein